MPESRIVPMTTGPVEETTDPAPTTGPVEETTDPAPVPARFLDPRRLAIVWGVACGLLALAFVVTVVILNSTVFSAPGFVSAYLQSLARQDVAAVLALPGVEADDEASAALLQRDALGRLSQVELVSDEDLGAGEHEVTYSYRVGGQPGKTTFVVQHSGPRFGVFNGWEFAESPLTTVEVVPRNTVEFEVNGVPVVAAAGSGEVNSYQVLVPGAYVFSHDSLYLEAEETVLPVTATDRVEQFVLNVTASQEFEDAVSEELAAYLDRCAEEEVLQPTGCPFGRQISNRLVSAPQWDITDYPRVEVLPGDQIGTWVVPPAHGTANLQVEVKSLFDGTLSSLDEAVPFSVSYLVTFTADGGLTLTPR